MAIRGDDLKFGAPTIVSLLLLSTPAFANVDLEVGSTFRSYPLSGVVEAEAGYGVLLWGQTGSPWYGYTRAHIVGATAARHNSGLAALSIYPLSFLGGQVGGESIQNDVDYSAYDCVLHVCRGRFYRTYAQADVTLGAGPVFSQFRWRRERWTMRDPAAVTFVEPTSSLALNGLGDWQTIYRGMVGVKLNPNWSVMAVLVYTQSDSSKEISRFPFAVVRYTSNDFSVGVGGGAFSSPEKKESASALLFLRWTIVPSLALH